MFRQLWKMFFPKYSEAHYTTVKYAFPVVLVTAFLVGLASIVTSNDSYVTIRTDADTITKDQQFYIDVLVTAHVPINAVNLVIAYPLNQIVVDGIDTGTSVITLWTEKPYAKNGNIYLSGGTFRKGFLGEHTIARIRAHAIESGEAKILLKNTELVAGDGLGSPVKATKDASFNEVQIFVGDAKNGVITGKASVSVVTDTNGDGSIDFDDIKAFMSVWFTGGATYDFNGDGRMTFKDFSILLADSFFK